MKEAGFGRLSSGSCRQRERSAVKHLIKGFMVAAMNLHDSLEEIRVTSRIENDRGVVRPLATPMKKRRAQNCTTITGSAIRSQSQRRGSHKEFRVRGMRRLRMATAWAGAAVTLGTAFVAVPSSSQALSTPIMSPVRPRAHASRRSGIGRGDHLGCPGLVGGEHRQWGAHLR